MNKVALSYEQSLRDVRLVDVLKECKTWVHRSGTAIESNKRMGLVLMDKLERSLI